MMNTTPLNTAPITDVDAMRMFNIDLGAFVEGTNKFVDESDRIGGDELNSMFGITMFAPARESRASKVVDPSAMNADELRACQRAERAERTSMMADMVNNHTLKALEDGDVSLTDLLPPPTHIRA